MEEPDLRMFTDEDPSGYARFTRNYQPAALRPDWWRGIVLRPVQTFVGLLLILVPMCLTVFVSYKFAFLLLIPVLFWWGGWIGEWRNHFAYGKIYPGVVVSVNPPRVAMWGDLTLVFPGSPPPQPTFAVKVFAAPLRHLTGGAPIVGDRVAVLIRYHKTTPWSGSTRWDDFCPFVVACMTRNQEDIQRACDSIPEYQWAALERALPQVPQPFLPGLYIIDDATLD